MEQPLLTYGLYEGNELKHVAAVDNGMACNCICAHCKHPLVAKNNPNNKKIAHFAHKSGKECDGAIETTLHLLAKIVLSKTKTLKLPLYHYDYNPHNEASVFPNDDTFVVNKELIFDEVLLETPVTIDGETFIPDAIGKYKEKVIYIEFAKTHFVDEKKKGKIKKSGMACIEINLSDVITNENTLIEFFNSDRVSKYWIINPVLDKRYVENQEKLEKRKKELEEYQRQKLQKIEEKLQQYRENNEYEVFTLYGREALHCPQQSKNTLSHLKDTPFYNHRILKRIIDGESWYWSKSKYLRMLGGTWIRVGGDDIAVYQPCDRNRESAFFFKGLKIIEELTHRHYYCRSCRFLVEQLEIENRIYGICKYKILKKSNK